MDYVAFSRVNSHAKDIFSLTQQEELDEKRQKVISQKRGKHSSTPDLTKLTESWSFPTLPSAWTPDERKKHHYEDLFGCLSRNFGKGFLFGGGMKCFFACLQLLAALLRRREPTRDVVKMLTHQVPEFGLFGGALLALFNGFMYCTRQRERTELLGEFRAVFAAALASLSLVLAPAAYRTNIALIFAVRALEVQVRAAVRNRLLPPFFLWENWGDVSLMSFASAQVVWAYIYHPESMSRSYRKFFDRHSQLNAIELDALRAMCKYQALPLSGLNQLRAKKKLPALTYAGTSYDAKPWSTMELIHPTLPLPTHIILYFLKGLKLALPVYIPVFALPMVLFSYRKLIRDPVHTLQIMLQGVARSSLFLSAYCTIGVNAITFIRALGLRSGVVGVSLAQLAPMVSGAIAGGLSVIFEKKSRRMELALYIWSQALVSVWDVLKTKWHFKPLPYGEVLIFALSFASIMHAFVRHPKDIRPTYSSIIQRFFDSDERHQTL